MVRRHSLATCLVIPSDLVEFIIWAEVPPDGPQWLQNDNSFVRKGQCGKRVHPARGLPQFVDAGILSTSAGAEVEVHPTQRNGNGNGNWKWKRKYQWKWMDMEINDHVSVDHLGYGRGGYDRCSLSLPFVTETGILVAFSTMSFEQVHKFVLGECTSREISGKRKADWK